jgi:hypothetical protein
LACSQLPIAALHAVIAAGVLWSIAAPAWGQCEPEWVQRFDVPAARARPAMAYDAARQVVVLIGGDNPANDDAAMRQMWEWNGVRWTRRTDVVGGPQGELDFVEMAYDSWRGVSVVRVRRPDPAPPETWEFDGQTWSLRATGGPAGPYASMTFDSWRGVTVLWARVESAGTWEWDGVAWRLRDLGPGNPGEGSFELAFDESRGVTVAFGLRAGQSQTWEWDGQNWTQAFIGGPELRGNQGMAYDPALKEVVIFGGNVGGFYYDDTWAWNGSSWRFITAGQPSKRSDHAMVYDAARGELVVFGGEQAFRQPMSETWTFDGDTWALADEGEPEARYGHGMAYDRARSEAIMFSGSGTLLSDTWRHDGSRWRLAGTAGPSRRHWPSMAYDRSRSVTVLFAGADGHEPVDAAVWEWDGKAWFLRATDGPAPRYLGSMAYDSARKAMVLFGGFAGAQASTYFNDTWEWDGSVWTQRVVSGPSPRSGSAIAYDEGRSVIVLFGGFYKPPQGANVYHADTWEWDGAGWRLVSATGPSGRLSASMVYDETSRRAILFAGLDAAGRELNDTWGWDGVAWTQLATGGPSARWAAGAVYVPDRRSILLLGGLSGSTGFADTWEAELATEVPGDLDCDCELSAFDIEPFILALVDPASYAVRYPDCSRELADLNRDGVIDVFDIEPFAEALVP